MNLVILCECGNCLQLPSDRNGNVYFNNVANGIFRIDQSEIDIEDDVELSLSLEHEFVDDLSETNEYEEVVQILEKRMVDNISADVKTELKNMRIDCDKCHNYFVLNF